MSLWSRAGNLLSRWFDSRIIRGGMYASFFVAGIVAVIFPPATIVNATGGIRFVIYVWAVLMIVAGAGCFLGIWLKTWLGEFVFLWGLVAAIAMLAGALFIPPHSGPRIAFGLVLLGLTFGLIARWWDTSILAGTKGGPRHAKGAP